MILIQTIRSRVTFLLLALVCSPVFAAPCDAQDQTDARPSPQQRGPSVDFLHGRLRVSPNGRYLIHADGTPFFYLGDTAWELFHRLKREEADRYLENRRQKGFTVVQAVALAEFDGLNTPNAYGDRPLVNNDPAHPNEAYFKHVDYIVGMAEAKGIYIGLLPTWGDKVNKMWGVGPVVFNPEKARAFGRYLGERYRNSPNIIWILGGDRPAGGFEKIWQEMAAGLIAGDGGRHLLTYHPMGGHSSSEWFGGAQWLAFNMLQSGHARYDLENYRMIALDYARSPVKPCFDGEPRYEDHPVNWKPENGWFDDFDVRQAAYWAVFAGAHGHTYGCHDIWQFYAPGRTPISSARTFWYDALDLPGAGQMLHLRRLIESRPFLNRIPDQSVLAGEALQGAHHVQATRGEDRSYLFAYVPTGNPVAIQTDRLSGGRLRAYWFNPREGTAQLIGEFSKGGARTFTPPSAGRGHDWVLVLDDAARRYPAPGTRPYAATDHN